MLFSKRTFFKTLIWLLLNLRLSWCGGGRRKCGSGLPTSECNLGSICLPTMLPSKPWLPLLLFGIKASSISRRIGMASMTNTLGIFALLAAAGLQNERWHFLVLLDERSLLNPTDSATKRGLLAAARTSILMMTMQVNK